VDVRSFDAVGDGVTDDTAAIQAALSEADGRTYGRAVYIPQGAYKITATLTVGEGVSVFGPPLINSGSAALYHTFNGNLFNISESTSLSNLYLINNGAYTGAAIYHVTPDSTSRGFFTFDRIIVTDFTTDRGWERDVYIDGNNGSMGVRSIFFHNCQFFGASTVGETVYVRKGVHVFFTNCEIVQSPQSSVVCGIKIVGTYSEDIYFSGCSIDGNISSDAVSLVFNGRVRQGRTITCNAGSSNNVFAGDVHRATFTNNGERSNIVEGGQTGGMARGSCTAVSIPDATFTIPNLTQSFDWSGTDDMFAAGDPTKITIKDTGTYRVEIIGQFDGNATGIRLVQAYYNGSSAIVQASQPAFTGAANSMSAGDVLVLTAADYVQLRVYQNSTGALNLTGSLSVTRIR
jgi:hypothetical protein